MTFVKMPDFGVFRPFSGCRNMMEAVKDEGNKTMANIEPMYARC